MTEILFSDVLVFKWPVKVAVPVDGSHTELTFAGHFEAMDDVEWCTFSDASKASEVIQADIDKLSKVFKGWDEGALTLPDGCEFKPTPENVLRLLRQRPYRLAVNEAYAAAMNPVSGARAGN